MYLRRGRWRHDGDDASQPRQPPGFANVAAQIMVRALSRTNRKDAKVRNEILGQSSNGPDGVVPQPIGLRAPRLKLSDAGSRTRLPVSYVSLPCRAWQLFFIGAPLLTGINAPTNLPMNLLPL
jgi:hypothetical protein